MAFSIVLGCPLRSGWTPYLYLIIELEVSTGMESTIVPHSQRKHLRSDPKLLCYVHRLLRYRSILAIIFLWELESFLCNIKNGSGDTDECLTTMADSPSPSFFLASRSRNFPPRIKNAMISKADCSFKSFPLPRIFGMSHVSD